MTTAPTKTIAAKRTPRVSAVAPKPAVLPAATPAPTPARAARVIAKPAPKATRQTKAKTRAVAPKPPAKPLVKPVAVVAPAKPLKVKKPKLVRDSFTIPKAEYGVLEQLKQRAAKLAQPAKKSELLRAGIKALAAMPDAALLAALKAVPTIKTGRPKG